MAENVPNGEDVPTNGDDDVSTPQRMAENVPNGEDLPTNGNDDVSTPQRIAENVSTGEDLATKGNDAAFTPPRSDRQFPEDVDLSRPPHRSRTRGRRSRDVENNPKLRRRLAYSLSLSPVPSAPPRLSRKHKWAASRRSQIEADSGASPVRARRSLLTQLDLVALIEHDNNNNNIINNNNDNNNNNDDDGVDDNNDENNNHATPRNCRQPPGGRRFSTPPDTI